MAKLANAARSGGRSSNGRKAASSRTKTSAKTRAKTAASTNRSRASSKPRSRKRSLVEKAKAPALAAGGMLLGAAGGTIVARGAKRRRRGIPIPRPKGMRLPKRRGSTAAWVGEKAKEIGDVGHRVADLTSDVAKVEKSLRN